MSDKRMSPKDFQTLGFLQEVNRRLLHPCGLALAIEAGPVLGESQLVIVDCREKPEGMYFEDAALSRIKAQAVVKLFQSKLGARREVFGHIVQPVPDYQDE